MSRNILPMAVLVSSLFMSPVTVGEVYKWVDAQGQAHYSDQQPQTNVEKVEVIDLPGAPAESSQAPVPDQRLETIKALAQELAQRLEAGVGQDPQRARELAQELVQQLEMSTDQGLGRIRDLARELMRQLEADTGREPERIPKMARNLVQEIKDYEATTLTQPSSPEQDLERIRKLTREWEAERKNLQAEREALEEQRRQESLAHPVLRFSWVAINQADFQFVAELQPLPRSGACAGCKHRLPHASWQVTGAVLTGHE